MRLVVLSSLFVLAFAGCDQPSPVPPSAAPAEPAAVPSMASTPAAAAVDDSKVYYSMGFMTGKNIQGAIPGMDIEKFSTGLKDAFGGKQPGAAK